jgi:LmbE family N-acetylglucosaminyl deacetylase
MLTGRRILALSPHPDDVELGAGGTIARAVADGSTVWCATLSFCDESGDADVLAREAAKAARVLGMKLRFHRDHAFPVRRFSEHRQDVLQYLVDLGRELDPEIVLLPRPVNRHQDHEVVACEARRAFPKCTLLGYEQPWNDEVEPHRMLVRLEEGHVMAKLKALEAYQSQGCRHYFSPAAVVALCRVRGVQARSRFAEAFEPVRITV